MDKRVIMSHKMLIDGNHPEETRVVVVSGNKVEDFDFESAKKRQVSGNIYLAKVTRVEPSLQAAFLDYGGNRHGFLAFSEIHPDYYQIPKEDKVKLIEESKLEAKQQQDEIDLAEENIVKGQTNSKSRVRKRNKQIKKSANEDIKELAEDSISEEIAEDGAENGNRKLVPLISRHGGGLDDNDYINCNMKGWCAKITEGQTKLEVMNNNKSSSDGFIVEDDNADDQEIPFE